MTDRVVDMSKVLDNMREALESTVATSNMVVKQMEPANTDPKLAMDGWVGLYADVVEYGPKTVGMGGGAWETDALFRVMIQASHGESTRQAHVRLEDHIKRVVDVILDNRTLGGLLDALASIRVEYAFSEEDRSSMSFIGAILTFNFVGRTN